MNNTILLSGSQWPVVTTQDAAVQCNLLNEPLVWCNLPESRESNMKTTESESASEDELVSESDLDYSDTDDYCSEDIEWY